MATATEDTTDIEARLRSLGAQADRGAIDRDSIEPLTEEPDSSAETVEAPTPEESEEVEVKPPASEEKPSELNAETVSAPKKSKAEKEEERKAKGWQALDAEKAAARAEIEAEKAKIKADREEIERLRAPAAEKPKPSEIKDEDGNTPSAYERFAELKAKEYERTLSEGDHEGAEKAKADYNLAIGQAQKLRGKQAEQQRVEYEEGWWKQGLDLVKQPDYADLAHADGGKPAGPLFQEMCALLAKGTPTLAMFQRHPKGFQIAADLVRYRHEAKSVPALKTQIEALTKENKRLQGSLSISPTGPNRSNRESSGKTDHDESSLRALAEALDSQAA